MIFFTLSQSFKFKIFLEPAKKECFSGFWVSDWLLAKTIPKTASQLFNCCLKNDDTGGWVTPG